MKYNIGDKVLIKSYDWYKQNKDENGSVLCNYNYYFTRLMTKYCGEIMTVKDVISVPLCRCYMLEEDEFMCHFTDDMIEGLVEEEEIEFTEEDKYWCDIMSESDPTTYVLPEGYQFVDENGNVINATKIVLEKKKKEYPKTYEECLSVLEIYNGLPDVEIYNAKPSECKLFESLIRLKRCRDAYWKIAGEEMGLGKPWEPDYTEKTVKYCLRTNYDRIVQTRTSHDNHPFSFPTEEMRDAFYENFKELINNYKELL